jgi:hypothetical protein
VRRTAFLENNVAYWISRLKKTWLALFTPENSDCRFERGLVIRVRKP